MTDSAWRKDIVAGSGGGRTVSGLHAEVVLRGNGLQGGVACVEGLGELGEITDGDGSCGCRTGGGLNAEVEFFGRDDDWVW
ncbi:hypothetical protein RBB78_17080 [Tunturiibacter empetritectus]|uniref:hypothetical protein n=1 Tax=Tunturiibacter empetritectus TaxID=3069691 RepID=UPI003D9ABD7E